MPATVTAVTKGNSITITTSETLYGITTTTKVVRKKNQIYSNITGSNTAPIFSLIDHTGATVFTKLFSGDAQDTSNTHSLNSAILFSTIWAAFNTWNGGVGAAALLHERICLYQVSQVASGGAISYNIVKNTLSGNIPLLRTGAGVYAATTTIANFNKAKASFSCGGGIVATHNFQLGMSADVLTLTTSLSGTATDNLIPAVATGFVAIEIRQQH